MKHLPLRATVATLTLLTVVGCSRTSRPETTFVPVNDDLQAVDAQGMLGPSPSTTKLEPKAEKRVPGFDEVFASPVEKVQFVGPGQKPLPPSSVRISGGQGQFIGSIGLYGELTGMPADAPTDSTDNIRQISFTQEGADFDVAVNPDGNLLAYASTRHRPTADIYVKRVNTNTITQITADPANDIMPAFSPDGKAVAFCSDRSGNWDIYIKSIDGGQPVQITNSPDQELHPSWSPDGRELVFCSLSQQSGQWELVVVDVQKPATRRFIGYGLFPEFSPTGNKIVFQRARFRGSRLFSIWTVDYTNGEGLRPTEIAAATNAAAITPSWSPDGNYVVFVTVLDPASGDPLGKPDAASLWLVNLDGTGRISLTNDRHANLQPVWSTDGSVYFVSNRSGWDNIWGLLPERSLLVTTPGSNVAKEPQAMVPQP